MYRAVFHHEEYCFRVLVDLATVVGAERVVVRVLGQRPEDMDLEDQLLAARPASREKGRA